MFLVTIKSPAPIPLGRISRVTGLVDQIAETPAEGVIGVCIKLAAAIQFEGDRMDGALEARCDLLRLGPFAIRDGAHTRRDRLDSS